jgi:hypothetical protein
MATETDCDAVRLLAPDFPEVVATVLTIRSFS